jgi:hypothetical protein
LDGVASLAGALTLTIEAATVLVSEVAAGALFVAVVGGPGLNGLRSRMS